MGMSPPTQRNPKPQHAQINPWFATKAECGLLSQAFYLPLPQLNFHVRGIVGVGMRERLVRRIERLEADTCYQQEANVRSDITVCRIPFTVKSKKQPAFESSQLQIEQLIQL